MVRFLRAVLYVFGAFAILPMVMGAGLIFIAPKTAEYARQFIADARTHATLKTTLTPSCMEGFAAAITPGSIRYMGALMMLKGFIACVICFLLARAIGRLVRPETRARAASNFRLAGGLLLADYLGTIFLLREDQWSDVFAKAAGQCSTQDWLFFMQSQSQQGSAFLPNLGGAQNLILAALSFTLAAVAQQLASPAANGPPAPERQPPGNLN